MADEALNYPLLLEARLVPRLWGGDALRDFHRLARVVEGSRKAGVAGPDTATAEPIGESWVAGEDNVVTNGPLTGRSLRELATRYGAALLGTANTERYGDKLALLAKFLDAKQVLSVQVHPDDAYALEHERETGHLGKAEAWYVLTTEPGAYVLWGFARDVTAEEVRQAVRRGDLESLMNRLPVTAGDVIVNPAGLVHAVGPGVMLFEIQQSSDLTYRLYDFDRRGPDGRPRELHVEKALDVAYLGRSDESSMRGRVAAGPGERDSWRRLVELPEFVLDAADLGSGDAHGDLRDATSEASLELLVVTRGRATVCGQGPDDCVDMERGDAVLLPAALGGYIVRGSGEVLRCAVTKRSP